MLLHDPHDRVRVALENLSSRLNPRAQVAIHFLHGIVDIKLSSKLSLEVPAYSHINTSTRKQATKKMLPRDGKVILGRGPHVPTSTLGRKFC